MSFTRWIKKHSRIEILVLAILVYFFTFLVQVCNMTNGSASYIIGLIFYLVVAGGLYAILCVTQFLPNEKAKVIALTAFLFYYALSQIGFIPNPFYYFGSSDGIAITFGVFFFFTMASYLGFFVVFLLQLFIPKIRLPRLLPLILLLTWIGLSTFSMIFLMVHAANNNVAWGNYFNILNVYLLSPILFFVAYESLYGEGETTPKAMEQTPNKKKKAE